MLSTRSTKRVTESSIGIPDGMACTARMSLVFALLCLLPGCLTSRYRHDVWLELEGASETEEKLVAWTWGDEEAFLVPVYLITFDTLLFPIDAVLSLVSSGAAMFDPDREIAAGPLGTLASLLPGISSVGLGGPGAEFMEPNQRHHVFHLSAEQLARFRQLMEEGKDREALEEVLDGQRDGERYLFHPRIYRTNLLHRVERVEQE